MDLMSSLKILRGSELTGFCMRRELVIRGLFVTGVCWNILPCCWEGGTMWVEFTGCMI